MRQTNGRPIGQRRYTKLLEDLCCNQLKLEGVKRGRDRYGSYFTGLQIRTDQDTALRPITGFEPPSPPDTPPPTGSPPVTESSSKCDGSVTAETLGSDGCDGCDAFFEINENNENFVVDETHLEPPAKASETENLAESVNEESYSITVAEPIEMVTSQPSHPSVTTHHNPSHPSQEVDYSTFPHLTSDTIEAKRNQALKIKLRLLEATNCEVLFALRQEESTRLEWTWKHLLTDAERNKITAVAQTLQLNLLTPGADVPAQVAQSPTNSAEEVAQQDENEQLKGWNQCHQATAYVCPESDSVEECQKRSLELRSAYRAAKSKSDLSALKVDNGGKFTKREHIWVQNWLKHFFPHELIHVNRLAKG